MAQISPLWADDKKSSDESVESEPINRVEKNYNFKNIFLQM
jgi:hypothetical protein